MPNAVIIDTETTGFDDPEPIEIAWVNAERAKRTTQDGYHCKRFKPTKPIAFGAMATHHILPEDLDTCPPPSSFALPKGTEYIIGHNIDYDWKVIGSPNVKRIDTCPMARKLWPECDSHSLSALTYYLAADKRVARRMLQGAHSAETDIRNTERLLHCIARAANMKHAKWHLWHAFSEECRIPTKMPFGKHKGKALSEVPLDYIDWLLNKATDPLDDPYLEQALRKILPKKGA